MTHEYQIVAIHSGSVLFLQKRRRCFSESIRAIVGPPSPDPIPFVPPPQLPPQPEKPNESGPVQDAVYVYKNTTSDYAVQEGDEGHEIAASRRSGLILFMKQLDKGFSLSRYAIWGSIPFLSSDI
jgi:hypothetical protein